MPLAVLPPGVTALSARATPNFNATLPGYVPIDRDQRAKAFAAAALGQDPRNLIRPDDIGALRGWMRAILGNSWRDDLSLDDVMRSNPSVLYKASALYLQGRYWGALPDDWSGPSSSLSPAFNWPSTLSPLEQRVFTWKIETIATAAPQGAADDAQGSIHIPILTPTQLIQKFDASRQTWRALNLGGTDRDFNLSFAGGSWEMRGWDFNEWAASNADWNTVLKIVGIAVVAVAAAVTGGAALIAGQSIFVAAGVGAAAAQTASQIVGAVNTFADAIARQNIGGAITALGQIVNVAFNVDIKSFATWQPGINDIEAVLGPYLDPVFKLGGDTYSAFLQAVTQVGVDVNRVFANTQDFLRMLSQDATLKVTGMFPDAALKAVAAMGVSELGEFTDKVMADYTGRARVAIEAIHKQVPLYLRDWQTRAQNVVKQSGYEAAVALSPQQPWFGRAAFDLGTIAGALDVRISRARVADIHALTPEQKRAVFLGDFTKVCADDPACLVNVGEFIRQSDLFWSQIQQLADKYNLISPAERLSTAASASGMLTLQQAGKK